MTKNDTIEAIMQINPTAPRGFLAEFPPQALADYLLRLSPRSQKLPVGSCEPISGSHEPWPTGAPQSIPY